MGSSTFETRLLSIQRNMLNFAYALTSNRDDAYDLVQDTTLRALDNEDKFVENSNFKGWVFTIMRNLFINNYRREKNTNVINDTSDDLYMLNMSQESSVETPEGAISVLEIREMLHSFNDDLRIPFTMYLSGYHYAEIAEHMNMPIGTVKSRIYLARKRLQSQLADFRYD